MLSKQLLIITGVMLNTDVSEIPSESDSDVRPKPGPLPVLHRRKNLYLFTVRPSKMRVLMLGEIEFLRCSSAMLLRLVGVEFWPVRVP